MKITCLNCGYEWERKSKAKLKLVTCPSCQKKTKVKGMDYPHKMKAELQRTQGLGGDAFGNAPPCRIRKPEKGEEKNAK